MSIDWGNESEKQIIDAAKRKADAIVREAEETARTIYAYSLEYADDMLTEVSLAAMRAKENLRQQNEAIMEEFDTRLNMLEEHKKELMVYLQELSDNGRRPMKKPSYHIKIDESYIPRKQSYKIKASDGDGKAVEIQKGMKQPYEIKVAEGWKAKVEEIAATEEVLEEEILPAEEGGFKASDFDLDGEYFSWLEEKENSHPD